MYSHFSPNVARCSNICLSFKWSLTSLSGTLIIKTYNFRRSWRPYGRPNIFFFVTCLWGKGIFQTAGEGVPSENPGSLHLLPSTPHSAGWFEFKARSVSHSEIEKEKETPQQHAPLNSSPLFRDHLLFFPPPTSMDAKVSKKIL